MPKRRVRYTKEQYQAMFAKMNQPHSGYKIRARHHPPYKGGSRRVSVTIYKPGAGVSHTSAVGELNLTEHKSWKYKKPLLVVTGARIDKPHRGKRLGTRMYVEALRLARKEGYMGVISLPETRSPASNRVWKSVRSKKLKVPTISGKLIDYDLLESVAQHRKRRGRAKRKALVKKSA
ncbi:MAG: hypothetical protein ACXAEN_12360 [Candidatus Thorarchaeota archaeon]|jgi:hypothetical protein